MKFLLQTQMPCPRESIRRKKNHSFYEKSSQESYLFFFFFCISEIFYTDREKKAWILKILFSTYSPNGVPASWKC